MAECYPQGCPPCDGPIEFPENPINGQRYCINIGLDPNTQENIHKCWVYDHCIPGWRAEGPTVSPINFKGGVDLTLTPAGNNISNPEAGDYYIVEVGSADVSGVPAQDWLTNYWASLQHEVPKGSFIMWSGTEWVEVPRPCAEIVQSDWLQTDDTADDYIKNKPTIPPLVGNADGGSMTVTADNDTPLYCGNGPFTMTAEANPVDKDGNPVIGVFEFTWQVSVDNGTNWTDLPTVRDAEVSYQRTNSRTIETYNGTDVYRLKVVFTDLYGNELLGFSGVITPQAGSSSQFVDQPQDLDLSTNTTGEFTTTATPIAPSTDRWYINGMLITGATTPDLGYTFSNWESRTLGVERTDANAGTYSVRLEIENAADCTPVLVSDTVQLIGPEAPVQVQPFVPGYGEVGSYTLERYRTIELITGTGNVYINTTFPWNGGTWKVMGTYFTTRSSDGNESTEDDLVLIMRIA